MATTYQKVELLNPLVADQVIHPTTTADLVTDASGATLS